jgi:hypothetical protein
MANTILIKKSAYNSTTAPSGSGASSSLDYGELGWLNNNGSAGKLYIGGKNSSDVTAPVDIQANIIAALPVADDDGSTKGIAAFVNDDFDATNGVVSIAANAIEAANIENNAVTEDKINNGAVTVNKLGNSAVTTAKVNNEAITTDKLNQEAGSEAVTTATIRALNVTSAELATNSVINAKIADSAVTSAKIAQGTIVAADIANGTITGTQIASGITLQGDVTITGDITVGGTETVVNSTNLAVADKQITVASNITANAQLATTTGVADAGFRVGTHNSAPKITWQNLDTTQYFEVSNGNFKATLESSTIDCGNY